jgi:hypothetical protein
VPLSPASIKKILQTFAAVLDEAVEDRLRPDNPARSRRMRIQVAKPKRRFLEPDELAALFTAARDQDATVPDLRGLDLERGSMSEKVARLAATGKRPGQIADQLAISKPSVTYHLHRLGIELGRGYAGFPEVARAGFEPATPRFSGEISGPTEPARISRENRIGMRNSGLPRLAL